MKIIKKESKLRQDAAKILSRDMDPATASNHLIDLYRDVTGFLSRRLRDNPTDRSIKMHKKKLTNKQLSIVADMWGAFIDNVELSGGEKPLTDILDETVVKHFEKLLKLKYRG